MTTPAFKKEVRGILGITTNGGPPRINAVHTRLINCTQLRCEDIWITGSVKTPILSTFADGSVGAPSITFTNDTDTGFYRPSAGAIGVSGSGANLLTISSAGLETDVPITTSAGNLVLNPAGSSVDFSGKTLVNVGGISTNPNRYEVIGTDTTTTDATPTVILTVPLAAAGYNITIDVVYVTGTSVATLNLVVQAKNTGAATATALTTYIREDAPLTSASATASASGTNVIVTAVGIAATTIKWQAVATVTRVLY
jgi:hypothetical protein